MANVGANAQAAPTSSPRASVVDLRHTFGGKPLTETDPMVMQQAQQAARVAFIGQGLKPQSRPTLKTLAGVQAKRRRSSGYGEPGKLSR